MNNQDKVFSDDVIAELNIYGVNQAGACGIAELLYKEWIKETITDKLSFENRCQMKFNLAPYDEFE